MHISELASKTGVSLRSLRYYEKQGILKPSRMNNGYRIYEDSDVDWVKTIQVFLSFGTTTEEISNFLKCQTKSEQNNLDSKLVVNFYEDKLSEIRKQIENFQQAEILVEKCLSNWKENQKEKENNSGKLELIGGKNILLEEVKEWV